MSYKTDIEIAQECKLKPIDEIAEHIFRKNILNSTGDIRQKSIRLS